MRGTPYVGVVGPGEASALEHQVAEEAGAALADLGAVVVTGGLGGVMEAACRGARSRRGLTLGLLPGEDRDDANGWVEVAVATGLGELRNGLLVRATDGLLAIGRSPGTLSEVAFALRAGKPVVGLGDWADLHGVEQESTVTGAVEALARALPQLRRTSGAD